LNAMTMTQKFVVSCEILGLDESFQGTWFGHAFFKTCQYGTTKDFFCKNFKHVSIKVAQSNLQKCVTRSNFFGKGKNGTKLVWILKFTQESVSKH
jgi:hypothetical protein